MSFLFSPTPKSPDWLPLAKKKSNEEEQLLLQEAAKEEAARKRKKVYGTPLSERLEKSIE